MMFAGKKKYLLLLFLLMAGALAWGVFSKKIPHINTLLAEKESEGAKDTHQTKNTGSIANNTLVALDVDEEKASLSVEKEATEDDSNEVKNELDHSSAESTEEALSSEKNLDVTTDAAQEKADIDNEENALLIQALEESDLSFFEWKKRFHPYAIANGIEQSVLDTTLNPLSLNQDVLDLTNKQPEFSKPIWEYLGTAVSSKRVSQGRKLLARHRNLLTRIEKNFGVQPEYIVAIWGLETGYGGNFGGNNVPRSLATLAYGSERKEFYRRELLAALKIIQQGDIDAKQMVGSWAGAMGHTQFMPSTFENFAISFDGDERRDLWKSLADVFASTANYLEKSGWEKGQPWGIEVKLPGNIDWELADPSTWLTVAEWSKTGILKANGDEFAGEFATKEARLFLPAGHNGPVFLSFRNFLAIKQYNNADSYALAVGYLGDRIRGDNEIIAKWPLKDAPLSHNDIEKLQSLLTTLGYDTGGIDGKIGPNTRQALRRWQSEIGIPADGYVNQVILGLLQ